MGTSVVPCLGSVCSTGISVGFLLLELGFGLITIMLLFTRSFAGGLRIGNRWSC
jgi:hypothetical protein